MPRKSERMILALVALAATGTPAIAQQPGPRMRQPGPMMEMRHDSATMAHMRVIHTLVMRHDGITRTVSDLPDGVRTVTESDDPALALLIRQHVTGMYQLLVAGTDPGLHHTTGVVLALFRNKDKIHTAVDTTAKGIVVVQTSTDSAVVALLRQHAAEVTEMVRGGMEALHQRMMPGGGMMHGNRPVKPDTANQSGRHKHPQ